MLLGFVAILFRNHEVQTGNVDILLLKLEFILLLVIHLLPVQVCRKGRQPFLCKYLKNQPG